MRVLTFRFCSTAEWNIGDPTKRGSKRSREIPRPTWLRSVCRRETRRRIAFGQASVTRWRRRETSRHEGISRTRQRARRTQPTYARGRLPLPSHTHPAPTTAGATITPRTAPPITPPARFPTSPRAHRRPHSLNFKFIHSKKQPNVTRRTDPSLRTFASQNNGSDVLILYKDFSRYVNKGLIYKWRRATERASVLEIIIANCSAIVTLLFHVLWMP